MLPTRVAEAPPLAGKCCHPAVVLCACDAWELLFKLGRDEFPAVDAPRDSEPAGESPNRRHPPAEFPAAVPVVPLDAVSSARRHPPVDCPAVRLAWLKLRCCCVNGTRLIAAGCVCEKKCVLLKFAACTGAVTARLEYRKLALVGAIGTWPFTRLAERSCSALTCMVLANRPLAKSCSLTAVTPPAIRAFR